MILVNKMQIQRLNKKQINSNTHYIRQISVIYLSSGSTQQLTQALHGL